MLDEVQLLPFARFPHYELLLAHLRDLLALTGIAAEIELAAVEDADVAEQEQFLGSPTVRVDGEDVEPAAGRRSDFGLKCRLFATPNGLRGVLADEWLLAALQRAESRGADAHPAPRRR